MIVSSGVEVEAGEPLVADLDAIGTGEYQKIAIDRQSLILGHTGGKGWRVPTD